MKSFGTGHGYDHETMGDVGKAGATVSGVNIQYPMRDLKPIIEKGGTWCGSAGHALCGRCGGGEADIRCVVAVKQAQMVP
jgi:hypothetical protein